MNDNTALLRLTDQQIESLNLLFLAWFAPEPGADKPPSPHPTGGVFSFYHYELYKIIESLGIKTTPCKDIDEFMATAHDYNYIFSVYNRLPPCRNGEVLISSLCEYFRIPYMGAPPNIRALAEDKYLAKTIARSMGIPTLASKVYCDSSELDKAPEFEGPYFIKPRFGAASEDVSPQSWQENWPEAKKQVLEMLKNGKECLVEQGVVGTDVTVPVLGGTPPHILPCAEEISEESYGISTFRQKRLFEKKRTRVILEDQKLCKSIQDNVAKLLSYVKPFDYMRVDFRLNQDKSEFYLLEFNICCNLGSYAAIAQAAEHVDIPHADLINHILCHSISRQDKIN